MKLTPLDIHHKEFHRSIRGYNEEEVDVFLDEIADEFERLFKENVELQQQMEDLNQKMTQYKTIEATLQNTLFTAQKTAEEIQSNAKKESELILRDAELKAKDMIQQALAEKQRIQQIMLRIKQAEEEFRMKFKSVLDNYTQNIQEVPVPEDILLLTTSDGEAESNMGAALVIDRPKTDRRRAPDVAPAPAEAKSEDVVAEKAAVDEVAAKAPAEPEGAGEPAHKGAGVEAPSAIEVEAEREAEPEPARPLRSSRSRAAASDATVAEPSEEPLLSSDVATVASSNGSVKGLQLGEIDEGPRLGDDIELPDFLKDPIDRTEEERERLKKHAGKADLLGERDEDADIEEIS